MAKKHDWAPLQKYLNIHERILKNYESFFVGTAPIYSLEKITDQWLTLNIEKARLRTKSGTEVFVRIYKDIELDISYKRPQARVYNYTYHAWSLNGESLLRYCGPHEHKPYHHKHIYVPKTNEIKVDEDSFPHVSEFLDELIETF